MKLQRLPHIAYRCVIDLEKQIVTYRIRLIVIKRQRRVSVGESTLIKHEDTSPNIITGIVQDGILIFILITGEH